MSALVIVPVLFIVVGAAIIRWPDQARKYDQGIRSLIKISLIKNRDDYVFLLRVFGCVVVIVGFLVFFLTCVLR